MASIMDYTAKRENKAYPDGERNTDAILTDIHNTLLDILEALKN